jgi:hypothetical protein
MSEFNRSRMAGVIGNRQSTIAQVLGAVLFVALLPCLAQGQSAPTASGSTNPQPSTGWIGFEEMQYGASRIGTLIQPVGASGGAFATVLIFDTDLGYGVTDHITADIGVPVIFTRSPFTPVIDHDYYWSALLGPPYLDVRYSTPYHEANFTSILTGTIPVSNEDRTYTTGRFGVDWFNHVDEPFGNLTPFLNLGASNGAIDRFIMPRPYSQARPYQTLGLLGDAEVGAEYKFTTGHARGVAIGASVYLLVPGGPQKVFSRYIFPYSGLVGSGTHDQYWDSTFETTGSSKIDRDNGYSAWLHITRWRNIDMQLSYTHSVHYALDVYGATFTFDGRSLIKSLLPR